MIFSTKNINEASQLKENRPAEFDIEGNWGMIAEGLQMSLRFDKNVYSSGEPIFASVIIRNVNADKIICTDNDPSFIDYIILKGRSSLTKNIKIKPSIENYSRGNVWLRPGVQKMFHEQLNKYGITEPGEYVVTAQHELPDASNARSFILKSGNALFTIVDKQKPDDASAKPAPSSPSTKVAPSLTGKVPLVTGPNVMGRAATGNVGSAITGSAPGEGSSAGASDDSSKRGVVSTVSRFLTQGGAESSGRWGKIAVLLLFVVAAFLFMRRST
ncbi:MAG: hypothetical protein HY300_04360 [Verrucomicrobia bacterium]|nr:hypothetical protein [Verrucomicrobiota bacterium]